MQYLQDMQPVAVLDRLLEVSVLLHADMARAFGESGLTVARTHLLWELHQLGPSTQQQLATALKVSPRNVTGLVDALESHGFVSRRPHPTDRRATLVTLSEQGTLTMAEMERGRQELATELVADLDEDDLAGLARSLDTVVTRLKSLIAAEASKETP